VILRFERGKKEKFDEEEKDNNRFNPLRDDKIDEEKGLQEEEEGAIENSNSIQLPNSFNFKYCYGKQSVIDAIQAIKNGQMVLVVDDEDRENEGDFIIAAEKATPEAISFIIRYSSGILCIAMEEGRLDELKLPPMVIDNEDPKCTAFTVSVDYKHGTTSGISASDRSKTFMALANPQSKATDFSRPGHVFPLKAMKGGVLERQGHTEATLDLMKMAGLFPAGVLCEVVDPTEDGPLSNFKGRSMARRGSLKEFANQHNIILTSIADLGAFRKEEKI
jgi:3,4-dihydroxy 2-butanone 4-phosphate synthase/GTP cyclohydrolase II